MTYNEWRDELKSNLLCVSEAERRRVLDYYAEAYADRRDAGFTEREIIEDFGAPYDAAQRILYEGADSYDAPKAYEPSREDRRREEREAREERREREREEREREHERREREREERERERREREERERREREERERREREARRAEQMNYGNANQNYRQEYHQYPPMQEQPAKERGDYTWVFVLLCIIFAIPIFIVIMGMVGITVGLCVAPIATIIAGTVSMGAGIAELFVNATNGALAIGAGLIIFGFSLILMPLCFKLVKWMWKLFHMFFAWLHRVFSGKKERI